MLNTEPNHSLLDDNYTAPVPTIPVPNALFLDTDSPSLSGALNSFEYNLQQLHTFISQPGIVRYDDLAQLRRRASNPAVSTNWRAQIRLAVELLRLGRRNESLLLLNMIDERMPLEPELNQVYRLWLAAVQAVAGAREQATSSVQKLTATDNRMLQRIRAIFGRMDNQNFVQQFA